ncbi:MAG: DNA starvation/stationary phase protection protein [Bacteroidetes bacterium]|nr:DNA starvation/stationary phase protection protein [Bacteroidota bacterium]MBU1115673.1 DNA starvation/stationary phase protection protein [Bacteroidota bacterium]MBU1799014.1 DNA starvation/stationary phase protection protein [Bacteroidota bacterium]
MKNKNIIGLEVENSKVVAKSLNQLLADHQIFYQNLRGFHWLILGRNFFQLHELFEKLYNEASETVDELAERILMLGETPLHSFESYLNNAKLKSAENVRTAKESLDILNQNMQSLLSLVRETLVLASENNDEGTVAMMSDLIVKYEKQLWMFSAYNTNID